MSIIKFIKSKLVVTFKNFIFIFSDFIKQPNIKSNNEIIVNTLKIIIVNLNIKKRTDKNINSKLFI